MISIFGYILKKRRRVYSVLFFAWTGFTAQAAVTVSCDFSRTENQRDPMRYHWNVSNRTAPMNSFKKSKTASSVGEKLNICMVRPLGGRSKDDTKHIEGDTYKWDGSNYVYDWDPLIDMIDRVQASANIFQLMIDNVPWAFQRGIDLKGEAEVETYGNAWPPNDADAWSRYIQKMMKELVKTYGREQVLKWRLCVGREIGTKGHWRGTTLEFFEHYANTIKAIHSVLPDAKVGSHFLWATSKHSIGPEFVKWCKKNNVHYDFIGVSYYPFYNNIKRVDLEYVYEADFAPIKDIPEWNPDAELEIHEFSLIKSMSKKGNSFDNAPKAHTEAFTVMLGKMMYEHGMHHVFRWGSGKNKLAEQAFLSMKDNVYYINSKQGEPLVPGNMIDGVFSWDKNKNQFNAMVYSYNADPVGKKDEPIDLMVALPFPPSTPITYRMGVYNEDRMEWSEWSSVKTKSGVGKVNSKLEFELELSSFSFQRLEVVGPDPAQMKRVLTKREDGSRVEVELGALKNGNLLCYARGRRYVIPIATLSDEDQRFLVEWANAK